jgi:hypothetical protein
MNNAQRKNLAEKINELGDLMAKLEDIKYAIESTQEEEQDKMDNMPESLQGGDKGDRQQSIIDALAAAFSSLEDAISSIYEAVSA